ncbi:uncharacterized protein LOC135162277 isoform X2 [Diachasmimorpha longicaudata]|uniref:uncharacterized protein LOC135162277 isoform X2 n=1 Tax=Diachasmimorpha longicaudata TaxID=58733 RepID=UPI0030B87E21
MSRPILSRPRTRVYGCNYDKGESYYKPMVDHLDRKYSGRPLFPEARTSLADEIAARRSDIGTRSLSGAMGELFDDDMDNLWEGYGRPIADNEVEEGFVPLQRRFKQRQADTFEEELAELRRKRRDLQDRLFDMVDIGAEIERAKQTLDSSNLAFERHALKFDNKDIPEEEPTSLIARLEKSRKLQQSREQKAEEPPMIKWSKYAEMRNDLPRISASRVMSLDPVIPPVAPEEIIRDKPTEKRRKKRSILKRKKSAGL